MPNEASPVPTVLVGHPFAPIGMGEVLRSTFRSLRSAQVPVRVLDAYGYVDPNPDQRAEFGPYMTDRTGPGANVFCINGDEVSPVLAHLGERARSGRRIIYPAWELPRYPADWARELEQFDEVWGFSAYTAASLAGSLSIPVHHIPLATQPRRPPPFGRRGFGIPEQCYSFLFFFDLRSYVERKNPYGALEAFRQVMDACPGGDVRFVIKVNGSDVHAEQAQAFFDRIRPFGDSIVLLDRTMRDAEVKALHLCCDAFVSLHRCEGYGFGPAEAMYFGKPTVATGYSGNMDYMTPETSHLLDYRLVSVPEGAYPHWENQVWAEPNLEQASAAMSTLVDDPGRGRALGAAASRHLRTHFSYRSIGLQYAARLDGRGPEALPAPANGRAGACTPVKPVKAGEEAVSA